MACTIAKVPIKNEQQRVRMSTLNRSSFYPFGDPRFKQYLSADGFLATQEGSKCQLK
jgi:hypothetical protein